MNNEPFVNYELIEKIRSVRDYSLDAELFSENVNISDLWSKVINFTQDELIICVIAALQKYPDLVYKVLAEDRAELNRKGKNNDRDSD